MYIYIYVYIICIIMYLYYDTHSLSYSFLCLCLYLHIHGAFSKAQRNILLEVSSGVSRCRGNPTAAASGPRPKRPAGSSWTEPIIRDGMVFFCVQNIHQNTRDFCHPYSKQKINQNQNSQLNGNKLKHMITNQWIWGTAKGYPIISDWACSRPRNDKRCSTASENPG